MKRFLIIGLVLSLVIISCGRGLQSNEAFVGNDPAGQKWTVGTQGGVKCYVLIDDLACEGTYTNNGIVANTLFGQHAVTAEYKINGDKMEFKIIQFNGKTVNARSFYLARLKNN
jgi:hypothetical protein